MRIRASTARIGAAGLVLLLACRPHAGPQAPDAEPPAAATVEPSSSSPPEPDDPRRPEVLARFEKIGVIGASVSAGFGSGVGLADTLDAALRIPHRIHDSSVSLMHIDAIEVGRLQVAAMRLRGVTMVFAVDFLVWFAYGDKSFEQRQAQLREGMAMLDTLEVPVVVGDLPDLHGASRRMIASAQIPSREQLRVLDEQLRAWADARPRVVRVPVADWMDTIMLEQPVRLGTRELEVTPAEALRWDHVHPTPRGQALLTLLTLAHLRQRWGGLRDDDVLDDPWAVADLVRPQPTPEGDEGLPPPP